MFRLSFLQAYRKARAAGREVMVERCNMQAALLPFAPR